MKSILILFLSIFLTSSCERTNPIDPETTKYCWNITSPLLVVMGTVCDKTAAEMATAYPDGWYYKTDEVLKCYFELNSNVFLKNFPPSLLNKAYPNRTFGEASCSYCARWFYREKRKYLPNSSITYSDITVKQFCGDTLATLYRGREVPLRQSTDSIITLQFSDNGTNW
jgi:hypothetical protein